MRIGIIGAMDEEIAALRRAVTGSETKVISGFEFTTGELFSKGVVIAKSGIGKVNAAISTTLLNHVYAPDCIINTGSAGGLAPSLSVGDIVVSNEVCYFDVDATAFGYDYGQVPRMPARYPSHSFLIALALDAARTISAKAVLGPIASGDTFLSDSKRKREIQALLPNVLAVEMEACSIAQVCYHFGTPFVVIRSISDAADKSARITHENFLEMVARISTTLVVEMVKKVEEGEF